MPSQEQLFKDSNEALQERLQEQVNYDRKEIQEISDLNPRLFPPLLELSLETSERLRALAKLSQRELKPAREITSHRPLIGPAIVFLKRLSWPIIRIHLKENFEGLAEFSEQTVEVIAKQTCEIEELKKLKASRAPAPSASPKSSR